VVGCRCRRRGQQAQARRVSRAAEQLGEGRTGQAPEACARSGGGSCCKHARMHAVPGGAELCAALRPPPPTHKHTWMACHGRSLALSKRSPSILYSASHMVQAAVTMWITCGRARDGGPGGGRDLAGPVNRLPQAPGQQGGRRGLECARCSRAGRRWPLCGQGGGGAASSAPAAAAAAQAAGAQPAAHLPLPERQLPAPLRVGRALVVDAAVVEGAPAVVLPQRVALGRTVVQHDVHDDRQAGRVRRVHERAQLLRWRRVRVGGLGRGGPGGAQGGQGWGLLRARCSEVAALQCKAQLGQQQAAGRQRRGGPRLACRRRR
jgi:hypothetical protein